MRSKQIVKEFIDKAKDLSSEEVINDALDDIVNQFIKDFSNLKKSRNIKFDKALIPLFKELDRKWNCVRGLLFKHYKEHLIKTNGFGIILKTRFPIAYEYYINQKSKK